MIEVITAITVTTASVAIAYKVAKSGGMREHSALVLANRREYADFAEVSSVSFPEIFQFPFSSVASLDDVTTSEYSKALVRWFETGLAATAVGMPLIGASFLIHSTSMEVAGVILFAFGSVSVALSLLRGEDIDERHR